MYTLGELIARLRRYPADKVVAFGFGKPDSYRGYYEQLAFEPAENVTIGSMLAFAEGAQGETFLGYKGGEFTMDDDSWVWIGHYGTTAGSVQITDAVLDYMLGDKTAKLEEELAAARDVVAAARAALHSRFGTSKQINRADEEVAEALAEYDRVLRGPKSEETPP